jgi:hypothetical protein
MNRIVSWKTAPSLSGCLLALLTVLPAGAAPGERPAPSSRAVVARSRYHLYGYAITRAGEEYTYLGSYCSAQRAEDVGKAACKQGEAPAYRVLEGDRLVLPHSVPAWHNPEITVYRLPLKPGDGPVGRFRTDEEALAAAEKLLAEGHYFQVVVF